MFSFTRSRLRYAVAVLVIAAAYIFFAKLGFRLAVEVRQVTAVWPPSGLAVAALFLGGPELWPGVALGAFFANLLTHEPPVCAAGIAAGNTLGPLVAIYALRRFGFDAKLERVHDVLVLALTGALAMVVTATNGVFDLVLAGIVPWANYGAVWRTWWNGDAMGVLLFAPPILAWIATWRFGRRGEGSWFELAAFVPVALGIAWMGFLSNLRLGFLVFPVVIWSALRFGQRVTSVAVVVISVIAIMGANNSIGPFSGGTIDQRLTYLMTLMAVLSLTGLICGAMTAERALAEERHHAAERRELEAATQIAATLQAAYLPKRFPERSDVVFDALYLTAGNQARIGGDWYDAITIPDGRLVITVGDMLGHGIGAAVAAGEIRQRILATAFNTLDPGEILTKVNGTLGDEHTLATVLVAFIDPARATMRYASAGHPPPIITGPTTTARLLPYGDIPLGVLPAAKFESCDVALEHDATILFYTDGVTEYARDIIATERALVDVVGAIAKENVPIRSAQRLKQRLMGSNEPKDDAVLVLVRLTSRVVRNAGGEPMKMTPVV